MKQAHTTHNAVETLTPWHCDYEALLFGADRITVDPTPRDIDGNVEKDAYHLDRLLFKIELDIRREFGSAKRVRVGIQFVDELIGFENAMELVRKLVKYHDIPAYCELNMRYTFEKKHCIYRFLRDEYIEEDIFDDYFPLLRNVKRKEIDVFFYIGGALDRLAKY